MGVLCTAPPPTGCAGTGKSFLLKAVMLALEMRHGPQSVHVTASTGIAASHIGGTTLHAFLGVGVPRELGDFRRMFSQAPRERLRDCRALVCDEVSMLSADFFTEVEAVVRQVIANEQKESAQPSNKRQRTSEAQATAGSRHDATLLQRAERLPAFAGVRSYSQRHSCSDHNTVLGVCVRRYNSSWWATFLSLVPLLARFHVTMPRPWAASPSRCHAPTSATDTWYGTLLA